MLTVNVRAGRYEAVMDDGSLCVAEYVDRGGVRVITHVETPREARGKGYAAVLMALIAAHAREAGLKLLPSCSYAAAWFERTPEARDVLG
jgi:hypothetical protein